MAEYDLLLPVTQRLADAVATCSEIPTDEFLSKTRRRPAFLARTVLVTLLKEDYGWSLNAIARELDYDHATIYNAYKKHRDNPHVAHTVESARSYLDKTEANPGDLAQLGHFDFPGVVIYIYAKDSGKTPA